MGVDGGPKARPPRGPGPAAPAPAAPAPPPGGGPPMVMVVGVGAPGPPGAGASTPRQPPPTTTAPVGPPPLSLYGLTEATSNVCDVVWGWYGKAIMATGAISIAATIALRVERFIDLSPRDQKLR